MKEVAIIMMKGLVGMMENLITSSKISHVSILKTQSFLLEFL